MQHQHSPQARLQDKDNEEDRGLFGNSYGIKPLIPLQGANT